MKLTAILYSRWQSYEVAWSSSCSAAWCRSHLVTNRVTTARYHFRFHRVFRVFWAKSVGVEAVLSHFPSFVFANSLLVPLIAQLPLVTTIPTI